MPDLKVKQREHSYEMMVRLRELHDPIVLKARRLRGPVSLSLVEPNHSRITKPKHSPITYKTKAKHSPRAITYKTKQLRSRNDDSRLPCLMSM